MNKQHLGSALWAVLLLVSSWAFANGATERFEIKAQALPSALRLYAEQTGEQVVFFSEISKGLKSSEVIGDYTREQALERLLSRTGLTFERLNPKTVAITDATRTSAAVPLSSMRPLPPPEGWTMIAQVAEAQQSNTSAQTNTKARQTAASDESTERSNAPEILVQGARILNADIKRSIDDAQPYVIFDSKKLEQSGATNLDDFLKTRLTANTVGGTNALRGFVGGATSSVNLRGLGENQTLILIDGRRAAKTSSGFSPGQPDINGIPLKAVERIEVLPTTASAIYGGSATGGVINIVMKRDYVGTNFKVTYDNSFDTDSTQRRIDGSMGFNMNEGRTNVLFSGSYSDANFLTIKDRDFLYKNRLRLLANNPSAVQPGSIPAGGATTNIRSATGSNLVLKAGNVPLNYSFTSAPVNYAGWTSDNGAALLANAGRYNLDVGNNAGFGVGGNASFVPAPRVTLFSGSMRHEFSDRWQGFVEASRSKNISLRPNSTTIFLTVPSSSPVNPFLQDIQVRVPTDALNGVSNQRSEYQRYAGGLIWKLGKGWVASADYTYTEAVMSYIETPALGAAFQSAINAGTFDILRDLNAYPRDLSPYIQGYTAVGTPVESTTKNPAVRLSGPLNFFAWKAGAPQVTFKLERQDIKYGTGEQIVLNGTLGAFFPERTQKVDSAYTELLIPLLGAANDVRWAKLLELQLAGRYDTYKTLNANFIQYARPGTPGPAFYVRNEVEDFNPLVGLRFQPLKDLTLRASFGTGFFPPEINQIAAPSPQLSVGTFADPRRGNTGPVGQYLDTGGGNPNLKPETSETFSAGFIFTPTFLEGMRLSLDYTHLKKKDNITNLTVQQILDNEAYFPARVTRGANLPGDQAGWAGPVTAIDRSTINSATASIKTYDLQLDYTISTQSMGDFNIFALSTWMPEFKTRVAASLPEIEGAGVVAGGSIPVKFKANGGLTWSSNALTLGWTTRYFDGYYVASPAVASSAVTFLSQGNGGRVDSQMYHDVFGQYRFSAGVFGGRADRLMNGLQLQVGVRNVFNKKPPYDVSNGFNYYSWLGDPRLSSYYISLEQSF